MPAWERRLDGPAAALTLLLALPAARADDLVDNLAEATRDTSILSSGLWAAQSFVTAASPVRLQSIEIPVGLAAGGHGIVAELHADAGPLLVGATLASLLLPVLSAGAPQVELLPSMPAIELAPGSTYWVVLGVVGAGSFGWSYAQGNASSGPGSLANFGYSYDGGASWLNFGSDNPYPIRVNVSPIPDPGMAALLMAGLLAIGSLHRRRNLRAAMACS